MIHHMADPYPYGLLHLHHHAYSPEPPPPPSSNNNNYNLVLSHDDEFSPSNHHQHGDFSSTNPTATTLTSASALVSHGTTSNTTSAFCSSSMKSGLKGWLGFDDVPNNRWPRQETLLLLEIRSRLDPKFRQTNHKAPLWNQISRIMSEEYGYQRTGKKCKEKFENLYKYYKKTKGGKAGRQDGRHYRFFRQLEAICGESSTTTMNIAATTTTTTSADNNNNYHQPPSMTFKDNSEALIHENIINNNNSSDQLETSSSEYNNDDNNNNDMSAMSYMMMKKQKQVMEIDQKKERVMRKSWRVEVEEIVESHMRNIIETQEAWMEKMMSVVENKELEMVCKEEERMRDSVRFDQQVRQLWAKERAYIVTRDTALMEVVKEHLGEEELTTIDHLLHHQPMVFEGYEEELQQSRNNIKVEGQNWRSQIHII